MKTDNKQQAAYAAKSCCLLEHPQSLLLAESTPSLLTLIAGIQTTSDDFLRRERHGAHGHKQPLKTLEFLDENTEHRYSLLSQ